MIKADVNAKVKALKDRRSERGSPAIGHLKFPFNLKKDQEEAVEAWIANDFRGSIVYRTGTGKTEIAFECARRAARANQGIVSDIASNTNFEMIQVIRDSVDTDLQSKMVQVKKHPTNLFLNLRSFFWFHGSLLLNRM